MIGKDVLFEFACAKDSNLGKVGQEYGIKVIRLCKESIDLEDCQSIDQLAAQVEALPGCSIHCAIECKPWSQWQHLNQARNPRLKARILAERAASEALVKQYIRIANICLRNGGTVHLNGPGIAPAGRWLCFSPGLLKSCFTQLCSAAARSA